MSTKSTRRQRIPSIGESPGEARPISLDVSLAELLALMKWHGGEAKKIKNRTGNVVLDSVFTMRDTRTLLTISKEKIDHHGARIKGLAALAREFAGKRE